jgi:hypothetical protein
MESAEDQFPVFFRQIRHHLRDHPGFRRRMRNDMAATGTAAFTAGNGLVAQTAKCDSQFAKTFSKA